MFLTSCSHKELCLDHDHSVVIRVVYDWKYAPEANPRGMVVWFYPESGTRPYRFDFANTRGGEVHLAPGTYHIISYNNDTEYARFGNTDVFSGHHIYTRESSIFEPATGNRSVSNLGVPRANGTAEERVTVSPDDIYGCTDVSVLVPEDGGVITLFPRDLLCHYSYEVRNVTSLDAVTNMCATLSGMSPTLHIHNEVLSDECVTIPLPAYRADKSTIRGEFLTFGQNPANTAPHRFGLYVWLGDGELYFYGSESEDFDVTDQIHSAADPKHVHFIIDKLELPAVKIEGGGLGASFDDWIEHNEEVVM